MKTKYTFAGATAATILALASPAHAGLLGGGGSGGFGGSLGGGLNGLRSTGTGSLSSQGAFNGGFGSPSTQPVSKAADKVGSKTADAKQGIDAAKSGASDKAGSVATAASDHAAGTQSPGAASPIAPSPSPAAAPSTPAAPSTAQASAPTHTVSGNGSGSLAAQHSPGNTSVNTTGNGGGSIN